MWACLAASGVAYGIATSPRRFAATRSQRLRFAAALAILAVACGWPLGDLAAHVSLSAAVVQRLLVMLAVAPLVCTSLPVDLVAALTRLRTVDRVVVALGHPAVAIGVVTIVGTVTLLPEVLAWAAHSSLAGAALQAVALSLGIVLWLPVLGVAPATRRLSLVARGGYLLAASLVVTSLSFVWIFAKRPLYASFAHQHAVLALSPIVDQQLAGFVSKFGAYAPLWAVAFVLFARAGSDDGPAEPQLRWVDVQRELERAERRRSVGAKETP
jgi:cytochrome c oxidase assembly factor CtaG